MTRLNATDTAWAVVAASVSASVLTTGGAFWLDASRARRRVKTARADELKAACTRIISGAFKVSQKAAALRTNMIARSGINEGLDVLLRARKPTDPLEVHDYLLSELGPVLDAQAVVWLSGDKTLIRSAGDVVLAIGEVIDKSTSLPKDRRLDSSASQLDQLKVALRGLAPLKEGSEEEAMRLASVRSLGLACAKFGEVMRKHLRMDDVDAILEAHPSLLISEPEESSNTETSEPSA